MGRRLKAKPETATPAPAAGAPDVFNPPAAERDLSFDGMRFEVQLGSSRIQAVQFNTCELGALSLEVTVATGETVQEAYGRAMAAMRQCRRADRDGVIEDHLDDLERAGELARNR